MTRTIVARIASIERGPRHILEPRGVLGRWRGESARGRRRTRLKHRNGAGLLRDGLNQRGHIVSFRQCADDQGSRVSRSAEISTGKLADWTDGGILGGQSKKCRVKIEGSKAVLLPTSCQSGRIQEYIVVFSSNEIVLGTLAFKVEGSMGMERGYRIK